MTFSSTRTRSGARWTTDLVLYPPAAVTAADIVLLHDLDNVAVAASGLQQGKRIQANSREAVVQDTMPFGHKIAMRPIEAGERVTKYGQTIGFATEAIPAGAWVHSHNLSAGAFDRDHAIGSEIPERPQVRTDFTFQGYRRGDGRCGTRNYPGSDQFGQLLGICRQIYYRALQQ